MTRPFRYSDCIRGKELYDAIPFPTFPKSIKIVSRTDLSLDKPANEGRLIYKKKNFQKKISKIFD